MLAAENGVRSVYHVVTISVTIIPIFIFIKPKLFFTLSERQFHFETCPFEPL